MNSNNGSNFDLIRKNGTSNSSEENLYEVPVSIVVVLSLFYGLISLTALVGNSLVIYVVVVSRYARIRVKTGRFANKKIAVSCLFTFCAGMSMKNDPDSRAQNEIVEKKSGKSVD